MIDEGIHVAAERTMNERDEHILFHLFDREIFDEVGPDPPVLFGWIQHLVVDPSAPRRLQERVIEEEAEPTTGNEDT